MCRQPSENPKLNLFLSAQDGKISITNWGDHIPGAVPPESCTIEEAAAFLFEHGVTTWMNSSSMDFGTDYGFEDDNLRGLIQEEMMRLAQNAENESA